GTRLHSGEVLEEMCEMRDSDAACRGSIAGGVADRAAEQLCRKVIEGYQFTNKVRRSPHIMGERTKASVV
ncbi:hypothetical protein K6W37_17385, partial [Acetobacter senegalensis]|nr:hypothetical protein [Acetobacter senegalensis]